ncbi:MAG: DUF423 domain-containing protein [Candidatus Marinimicrobia bacterium]|nr:DUF423 domain-containing protein [Candidatus Neomarinimicrobiota bacterium]
MKLALVSGSFFMALAVAFGAFGAHGLKEMVPQSDLLIFEKAVRYHFWHALALLVLGSIGFHLSQDLLKIPVILIIFGIIFFSGSLYILVITDTRWLGAVTPFGGTALIIAWCWLTWNFYNGIN